MLNRTCIARRVFHCFRSYSVSVKLRKELLIQQTTYDTDDWTNISARFEPFVGAGLFNKRNHPLKLAHEEIVSSFRKQNPELPIFKNLSPIEPNNSTEKDPHTFYVNRNLLLRTHTVNRTVELLKSHDDFVMVVDLYRKCQMDALHFPAFHRVNFVRTFIGDDQHEKAHLKDEQQTALIELTKHLIGSDIQYRWTDISSATSEPSWMFEILHLNEWHRISSGGLIRNELFVKSERPDRVGWEISINLDRLAMTLYNIFDVRQLWNSSPNFLRQFEPKTITTNKGQSDSDPEIPSRSNTVAEKLATRPNIQVKEKLIPKLKKQHRMQVSYFLSNGVDLETFPGDDLCNFIKKHADGAAKEVELIETYFHPELERYVLNVAVVYKKGQKTTKRELKNIHDNVRALAAHAFNLTIRT